MADGRGHFAGRPERVCADVAVQLRTNLVLIIHLLDSISQWFPDPDTAFRFSIPIFLSAVDLGIVFVLWRRYGRIPALLSFLSPVAILISGYHGQFDNFAVLAGMLAMICYESVTNHPGSRGYISGRMAAYVLLGVSLMIKHILFLFPVWLAFRERTWRGRFLAITVPVAVFLLGFVPYFPHGKTGIETNVFGYRGFENAPLWNLLIRPVSGHLLAPVPFFVAALVIAGYLTRRWKPMDALLMYTVVVITFAPTIANQYLAIVVPAIAVFNNGLSLLYSVIATVWLIAGRSGIAYPALAGYIPVDTKGASVFEIPIAILLCGLVRLVWDETRRSEEAHASNPYETSQLPR